MTRALLQVPGIVHGTYPQRLASSDQLQAGTGRLGAMAAALLRPDARRYRDFAQRVRAASGPAPVLASVRARLADEGLTDAALIDAFRLIIDATQRTLGLALYDSQLIAARVMLDARLAEMATGEGKTVAIALGAAAAALAGLPVHVITANQYLVTRDAAALGPLYGALGLSVGAIQSAQDAPARRAAYACDITYCTATELAFDYLRDGLARGDAKSDLEQRAARLCDGDGANAPVLRGLCLGLIDEADSCLIDDAQVPLILARPVANPGRDAYFGHALELARRMRTPEHYRLDHAGLEARLSEAGRAALETWAASLPPVWRNRVHREEALARALAALHLYRRDTHYLVSEGKVSLIDQSTGRIA
ncbi:MAG: preprotein translocase subunit SecA, partial [Burkholderiales bacterium]